MIRRETKRMVISQSEVPNVVVYEKRPRVKAFGDYEYEGSWIVGTDIKEGYGVMYSPTSTFYGQFLKN